MKDLQDWAAVQKLYKSTKNISYIAETLGMGDSFRVKGNDFIANKGMEVSHE